MYKDNEKLKRAISILLIVGMVISSNGFAVFAAGVENVIKETTEESANKETKHYYEYYEERKEITYFDNEYDDITEETQETSIDVLNESENFNDADIESTIEESSEEKEKAEEESSDELDDYTKENSTELDDSIEETKFESDSDEISTDSEVVTEEIEEDEIEKETTRENDYEDVEIASESTVIINEEKISTDSNVSSDEPDINVISLDDSIIATLSIATVSDTSSLDIAEISEASQSNANGLLGANMPPIPDGGIENTVITNEHYHKTCGALETIICDHEYFIDHYQGANHNNEDDTEMDDIGVVYTHYLNNTTGNVTRGAVFLETDAAFDSVINLSGDLYICLNGHNLTCKGFVGNGHNLTITNCKGLSKTSYTEGDLIHVQNGDAYSPLFENVNVDITSNYNYMINVKSPYVLKYTGEYKFNAEFMTFDGMNIEHNVAFDVQGAGANSKINLWGDVLKNFKTTEAVFNDNITSGNIYTFDDTDITDCVSNKDIFKTGADNINFKWTLQDDNDTIRRQTNTDYEVKIKNNSFGTVDSSGALFKLAGNTEICSDTYLIISENTSCGTSMITNSSDTIHFVGTLSIIDNKIDKTRSIEGVTQRLIDLSNTDLIVDSDLIIQNNKVVNGTTATRGMSAAIYIGENKHIYLTDKIFICNGGTTNESTNPQNFMNNILSENFDYPLVQTDGTLFDGINNRIGVSFATDSTPTGIGKIIKDFSKNTVKFEQNTKYGTFDFDYTLYFTIFAGTYTKMYQPAPYRDSDGVTYISLDKIHNHKLCGKDNSMSCSHASGTNHGSATYIGICDPNFQPYSESENIYFYLTQNIRFTNINYNIYSGKGRLRLCTNGFDISNCRFTSNRSSYSADQGGIHLYLCDCSSDGRGTITFKPSTANTRFLNFCYAYMYAKVKLTAYVQNLYYYHREKKSSEQQPNTYEFENITFSGEIFSSSEKSAVTGVNYIGLGCSLVRFNKCTFYQLRANSISLARWKARHRFSNCVIDSCHFSTGVFLITGQNGSGTSGQLAKMYLSNMTIKNTTTGCFINNTSSDDSWWKGYFEISGYFTCTNNVVTGNAFNLSCNDGSDTKLGLVLNSNASMVFSENDFRGTAVFVTNDTRSKPLLMKGNSSIRVYNNTFNLSSNPTSNGGMRYVFYQNANHPGVYAEGTITIYIKDNMMKRGSGVVVASYTEVQSAFIQHGSNGMFSGGTLNISKDNGSCIGPVVVNNTTDGKGLVKSPWNYSANSSGAKKLSEVFEAGYNFLMDKEIIDQRKVVLKNGALYVDFATHIHKICGEKNNRGDCGGHLTASGLTTKHKDNTHGYMEVDNAASISELVGIGENYIVLTGNIDAPTDTEILVEDDLYICLNGCKLTNFRFKGLNKNSKVVISNCVNIPSTLVDNVADKYIFDNVNAESWTITATSGYRLNIQGINISNMNDGQKSVFYNTSFNGLSTQTALQPFVISSGSILNTIQSSFTNYYVGPSVEKGCFVVEDNSEMNMYDTDLSNMNLYNTDDTQQVIYVYNRSKFVFAGGSTATSLTTQNGRFIHNFGTSSCVVRGSYIGSDATNWESIIYRDSIILNEGEGTTFEFIDSVLRSAKVTGVAGAAIIKNYDRAVFSISRTNTSWLSSLNYLKAESDGTYIVHNDNATFNQSAYCASYMCLVRNANCKGYYNTNGSTLNINYVSFYYTDAANNALMYTWARQALLGPLFYNDATSIANFSGLDIYYAWPCSDIFKNYGIMNFNNGSRQFTIRQNVFWNANAKILTNEPGAKLYINGRSDTTNPLNVYQNMMVKGTDNQTYMKISSGSEVHFNNYTYFHENYVYNCKNDGTDTGILSMIDVEKNAKMYLGNKMVFENIGRAGEWDYTKLTTETWNMNYMTTARCYSGTDKYDNDFSDNCMIMNQVYSESSNPFLFFDTDNKFTGNVDTRIKFSIKDEGLEGYRGTITDEWDISHVNIPSRYTIDSLYDRVFEAEQDETITATISYAIAQREDAGNVLIIKDGFHGHKICGTANAETCEHEFIESHADSSQVYKKLTHANSDSFANGGGYYLDYDLTLDDSTEIILTKDLYICLNGHKLTINSYFGNSNFKMYITDCSDKDTSELIFTNKSNYLFTNVCVNIMTKNHISVRANRVWNYNQAKDAGQVLNVDFAPYDESLLETVSPFNEGAYYKDDTRRYENVLISSYSTTEAIFTASGYYYNEFYKIEFKNNKSGTIFRSFYNLDMNNLLIHDNITSSHVFYGVSKDRTGGVRNIKNATLSQASLDNELSTVFYIEQGNFNLTNVDVSNYKVSNAIYNFAGTSAYDTYIDKTYFHDNVINSGASIISNGASPLYVKRVDLCNNKSKGSIIKETGNNGNVYIASTSIFNNEIKNIFEITSNTGNINILNNEKSLDSVVEIYNNIYTDEAESRVVKSSGNFRLNTNAVLNIHDNTFNAEKLFDFNKSGSLIQLQNSKLNIHKNNLKRLGNDLATGIIDINEKETYSTKGFLYVASNSYIGATSDTDKGYVSAIFVSSRSNAISVGSSSIILRGNTTDDASGLDGHFVYDVLTDMGRNQEIFKQLDGEYFNIEESWFSFESISSNRAGLVIYNGSARGSEEIVLSNVRYNQKFDDTINIYYGYTSLGDKTTIYIEKAHDHYACGVTDSNLCSHRLISDKTHTTKLRYAPYTEGIDLTEGRYYLANQDYELNKIFTVTGDLYICLHGQSISKVSFVGDSVDSNIYITDCVGGGTLTPYSDTVALFQNINVHFYVPDGKEVFVKGGYVTNYTRNSQVFNAENVVFDGNEETKDKSFIFNANINVNMASCSIINYKTPPMSFGEIENNVSVVYNTGGSTLNVYDVKMSQNNITQYLLYNGLNSTINIATGSSLDIVNNKSQFFHLAHIEAGAVNTFGQINITENTRQMIAHNSTMYLYNYAAFYIGNTAVVNMHNSKIYIYDNDFTVFSNSVRKHIYSYVYDVYTENLTNPFIQTIGEKIKEDSKIKVQLHRPFRGNVIKNWAYDTIDDANKIVELSYQKRTDIKLLMETLVGESIPTVLIDVEHVHTYCGLYASDAPCTGHDGLLDTHTEYYTFQSFIGIGDSKTDLSVGGRYFLELTDYYDDTTGLYTYDYAANHGGNPVVTVNNDLYLCLGGVSISNIVFRTTSDAHIYIMNCNHNAETYISQGANDSIFTEGNVSLIAPYGMTISGKSMINMTRGTFTSLNTYFLNEGKLYSGSLLTFGDGIKAKMINTYFEEIEGYDYITNNGGDVTLYSPMVLSSTIRGALIRNNVGTVSIASATIDDNIISESIFEIVGKGNVQIISSISNITKNTVPVLMNIVGTSSDMYAGFDVSGDNAIINITDNVFSGNSMINLREYSYLGTSGKDSEFNLTNNTLYRQDLSQALIHVKDASYIRAYDGNLNLNGNVFDNETTPVSVSTDKTLSSLLIDSLTYEETSVKLKDGVINIGSNIKKPADSTEKVYGLWTNAKASFSFIEEIGDKIKEANHISDIYSVHDRFDMIENYMASVSNVKNSFVLNEKHNEKTGYAIEVKDGVRHAVVRERYITFDMATPSDYVIKGSMSDIIIANATKITLPNKKYESDGLEFVGWSRTLKIPPEDTTEDVKADYLLGGDFDVLDTDTKVKLYATWEYANHRHMLCGATVSCTHKYISSHSDMIRFRPLRTTFDLSSGGNYFIDEGDVDFGNINVEVNGKLIICLNGYNMSGITFNGGSGNVYILNCKNSESIISESTISELPLFNNVNASVLSFNKEKLKVNAKKAVYASDVNKRFESLNVAFAQRATFSDNSSSYIKFENNKNEAVFENASLKTFNREVGQLLNFEVASVSIANSNISNNNMHSIMSVGSTSELRFIDTTINDNVVTDYVLYQKGETIYSGANIISDNKIKVDAKENRGVVILTDASTMNIKGNLDIKKNIIEYVDDTMSESSVLELGSKDVASGKSNVAAGIFVGTNSEIDFDGGTLTVEKTNDTTYDVDKDILIANIYSLKTDSFINLKSGTFTASTINADIAFGSADGSGTILKDATSAVEWNEVFDANLDQDKFNAVYSVGSLVRIGPKAIIFNPNLPDGYSISVPIASQSTAGLSNVKLDKNTYGVYGLVFKGWATVSQVTPITKGVAVLYDYEDEETIPISDSDTTINLYASWEYKEIHDKHKACGVATTTECYHMPSMTCEHSEALNYEILTGERDLTKGGNYFLIDDFDLDDEVITIEENAKLNICLNGFTLSGVRFVGENTSSKVTITNCKENLAKIEQSEVDYLTQALFTNVNVDILSPYTINVAANRLYKVNGAYEINAYDANMYSMTSTVNAEYFMQINNRATVSIIKSTISNVHANYGLGVYNSIINLKDVKLIDNTLQGTLMLYGNRNIANFDNVIIKGNEVIRNASIQDSGIIRITGTSKINLIGTTSIVDNTLDTTYKQSDGYAAAVYIADTESILNVGSGEIIIRNNKELGEEDQHNHMYGVYSYNDNGFIGKIDGTTFNENNYIENIAFNAETGIIEKNWSGEDNEVHKHYIADTTYNEKLGAYEYENNAIIGIRTIKFDWNAPADYVVTGGEETLYPGVATSVEIEAPTISIDDFTLKGWNYSKEEEVYDADTTKVPDIAIGDSAKFPISTDSITLYAFYVYTETHKHRVCGADEHEACKHDDISSHSDIIKYVSRLSTDSDLSHGGKFFLPRTDIDMKNISVTVDGELYICLNGHSLKGVSFVGANDNSKVYICNCKDKDVTMIQNTLSDSLFTDINAYTYARHRKLNLRTHKVSAGNTNVKKLEMYNININPTDGYNLTDSDEAIFEAKLNDDSVILSDVILSGFTTTNLMISNEERSKIKLSSVSVVNNVAESLMNYNDGLIELKNTNIRNNAANSYILNAAGGDIIADNVNINNNIVNSILINLQGATLTARGDLKIENNAWISDSLHISSVYVSNESSKIKIGNGNVVIDSIKNFGSSIVTNGIYSEFEKFMTQVPGTTFDSRNYFENVALASGRGKIMEDNNFTLSNDSAENSFRASTASNVDYRAYKGTNSNVVIGIRKVIFDYNLPDGETLISGSIDNINLSGKASVSIAKADLETYDHDFAGWSYDADSKVIDVENGGIVNTDINKDEFKLYAVWSETMINITYHPTTPSSIKYEYTNELTSELKVATTNVLKKSEGSIRIIESPYAIDGWTFKGWALATVSRAEADDYVLDSMYQSGKIATYSDMLAAHPSRDINLYAVWVRNTYQVVLHINDSREGNGTSKTSFDGWESTTKVINMRYDSTFEDIAADEGVSSTTPLLPIIGSRKGYIFTGEWTKTKDIDVKDRASWSETHADDIYYNDSVYRLLKGIDLYANWINDKYEVILHANDDRENSGSTRGSIIASDKATESFVIYYDATMSFVPKVGIRKGYTYGGLVERPLDIKERKTAVSVATTNTIYQYESDKDLYVNWINNEYNLTLDLNDGSINSLSLGDKFKVYYDAVYPFKWKKDASSIYDKVIDKPIKIDSEFHFFVDYEDKYKATWSDLLTKDAHDKLYSLYGLSGDKFTSNKDKIVVAWYSPTVFRAEFDADGGVIDKAEKKVIDIPYSYRTGYASSSYVIPNATKLGYTLKGWIMDGGKEIKKTDDLYGTDWFIYNAGENIHKLVATYSDISYNIMYSQGNLPSGAKGTLPLPVNGIKYSEDLIIPQGNFETKNDSEFLGWRIANGCKAGNMMKQETLPFVTNRLSVSDGETVKLEAVFKNKHPERGNTRGSGSGGGGGGGSGVGYIAGYWYYDMIGWQYIRPDAFTGEKKKLVSGIYRIEFGYDSYRYYGFDDNGYMVSGFYNFDEKTYYFNEDNKSLEYGAMILEAFVIDGIEYSMAGSGAINCVKSGIDKPNTFIGEGIPTTFSIWSIDEKTGKLNYVFITGLKVVQLKGEVEIDGIKYSFVEEINYDNK